MAAAAISTQSYKPKPKAQSNKANNFPFIPSLAPPPPPSLARSLPRSLPSHPPPYTHPGIYPWLCLLGTGMKYLSMAALKRRQYCGGWMMVGSACPVSMPTLLPILSILLTKSYCRM